MRAHSVGTKSCASLSLLPCPIAREWVLAQDPQFQSTAGTKCAATFPRVVKYGISEMGQPCLFQTSGRGQQLLLRLWLWCATLCGCDMQHCGWFLPRYSVLRYFHMILCWRTFFTQAPEADSLPMPWRHSPHTLFFLLFSSSFLLSKCRLKSIKYSAHF